MKRVLFIFAAVLLISATSCKQESKTKVKTNEKKQMAENNVSKNSKKGTLLFFMNPNGKPCQIQDTIISKISGELSKKVDIQYIKTTNPDDRQTFYDYTIRGLPALIIVDKNYSEVKRFTPGIRQKDEILKAVKEL